jgi:hypothetical protein
VPITSQQSKQIQVAEDVTLKRTQIRFGAPRPTKP